jgi:Domain of unknown function (DUF4062)
VWSEPGARPHPPRRAYRACLEQSQVFVGIYWQQYGWVAPGMEISGLEDEYRLAAGRQPLRPCGSWPKGGDEGPLSLVAAAPGHARWSACVVRAACVPGPSSPATSAAVAFFAAAAGPGTRVG